MISLINYKPLVGYTSHEIITIPPFWMVNPTPDRLETLENC